MYTAAVCSMYTYIRARALYTKEITVLYYIRFLVITVCYVFKFNGNGRDVHNKHTTNASGRISNPINVSFELVANKSF